MGKYDEYCVRIFEMKVLVEPFPLVPAIWMIGQIASRSDGYRGTRSQQSVLNYPLAVGGEARVPDNRLCAAIQSFQE